MYAHIPYSSKQQRYCQMVLNLNIEDNTKLFNVRVSFSTSVAYRIAGPKAAETFGLSD